MSKQNRRLTSSTSSSNGNITPKTSSTSRLNISNDYSAGRSYLDTDDDISLSDEELPLKKKRKKRIIEDDESDDELQSVVVHISDDDFSDTDTTIQNKPVALKHGADGKLCHECDYKDICDCLFTNCQGCFPSCPMCRGSKCGPICRKNRGYLVVKYIDSSVGTTRVNPCVSIYEN